MEDSAMEKSLVFVIQPKHLPSLGDLVSEEKNPLSPFNGVPAEGPPEAIRNNQDVISIYLGGDFDSASH